jgi:3'-phosphoadenosine 5'-phosphosulfate sulfotransferase (PAPS reductase)/FAD synthetase
VTDWYPLTDWTEDEIWADITASGVPHHRAYDLGMPRLSCAFCIFAPRAALMIAGRENPELLDTYVEIEREICHSFRAKETIESIRDAIRDGETNADEITWNDCA